MKKHWFKIGCTGLLVLTIFFLYMSICLSLDLTGMGINMIFVVLMAGAVLYGMGVFGKKMKGIRMLCGATEELVQARAEIGMPGGDEEHGVSISFSCEPLRAAYKAHLDELNRLQKEKRDFHYADIADHFNEELLAHIANTPFNDQVSGIMTGLGILGTFIGLVAGLRGFDPTTAETMMETIAPLIEGIKIAFLTSIFGVIYSILFNIFYHSAMEDATGALEDFLDAYYSHVLPRPENDGFTKLIEYQQKQSKTMDEFSQELTVAIAEAMGKSVVPTFQRIEQSIEQLAQDLAREQNQNMERIAADFVASFDKAMGGQMEHLGQSIQNLCLQQEAASTKMQETIEQYAKTADNMAGVCAELQGSISAMEDYLKRVAQMQGSLSDEYAAVVRTFEKACLDIQKQHETLQHILELEEKNLEAMQQTEQAQQKRLEEETRAAKEYLADMQAFCEQTLAAMEKSAAELGRLMTEAAREQMEKIQQGAEALTLSQQRAVSDLTAFCGAVRGGVEDSAEQMIRVMKDAAREQIDQVRASTETFMQSQQKASAEMNAFYDTSREIARVLEDTAREQIAGIRASAENLAQDQQMMALNMTGFFNDVRNMTTTSAQEMTRILTEAADAQGERIRISMEAIAQAQKDVSADVEAHCNEITKRMQENSATAIGSMGRVMGEQVRQIRSNTEQIEKTQSLFVAQMAAASAKLGASAAEITGASEELGRNLQKAMSDTYQQIDQQLAASVRQLTGTITDIRDITERVPRMLSVSADQMQSSTRQYLAELNASQRKMLEQLRLIAAHGADAGEE